MRQSNNSDTRQATNDNKKAIGLGIYFEGVPQRTNASNNNDTTSAFHNIQPTPNETYQERFLRNRNFFENGPLMRCLDKDEDKQRGRDILFNTLLTDVQQNPLDNQSYRGVVQIRSFWEDVRKQLRIDDGEISSPRSDEHSSQSQTVKKMNPA